MLEEVEGLTLKQNGRPRCLFLVSLVNTVWATLSLDFRHIGEMNETYELL